ncbi:thioredoxin family protein [Chengkuizengella axinellae]|uniref:Thioredoxin family protein n=1 Tax=Chengkuizengella axinellae TaxID=3064388 RepID=A0ABT9IXS0_9BACL|nr:thioredoxin family protein [Chengkuizengella sp. 2205SS18-9]MDP5274161.1 thioredoxin family protein [Chengkuizengella sp. 2205SS18-9]
MEDISENHFINVLNDKNEFALFIFTPMCGTCKLAERMLNITLQMKVNKTVYKSNINYLPQLTKTYEITSVPCLLLFKNRILVKKEYSMTSVDYLYHLLK